MRLLARERPHAHVLGVAFDGDADRALFVDESGAVIDGDRVMLVLAREKKRRGALAGDTVVGTVMSNIGLERALNAEGIALERAAVGDRYVLAEMRARGHRFGGEQSGHVIDLDRNTTGDGPGTAVALFSIVARSGSTLRELAAALHVAPQILVNVRTSDKAVLEAAAVRAAIERAERELGGRRPHPRPAFRDGTAHPRHDRRRRSQSDRCAGARHRGFGARRRPITAPRERKRRVAARTLAV